MRGSATGHSIFGYQSFAGVQYMRPLCRYFLCTVSSTRQTRSSRMDFTPRLQSQCSDWPDQLSFRPKTYLVWFGLRLCQPEAEQRVPVKLVKALLQGDLSHARRLGFSGCDFPTCHIGPAACHSSMPSRQQRTLEVGTLSLPSPVEAAVETGLGCQSSHQLRRNHDICHYGHGSEHIAVCYVRLHLLLV